MDRGMQAIGFAMRVLLVDLSRHVPTFVGFPTRILAVALTEKASIDRISCTKFASVVGSII